MKQIYREPLAHFFLLGAALFALFAWTNDNALQSPDDIVVDAMRVDALKMQFERVWGRTPERDELRTLMDNWVREEILYREGLSLGLDRNDPLTRRRVAQKMEFISEELVEVSPEPAVLEAWFKANSDDYLLDPRYTFQQLYLNPSASDAGFSRRVEEIGRALANGNVVAGDATMLQGEMHDATLSQIRRVFGEAFATSLQGLVVGQWDGPITSGYGLHYVRVDARQAARLPKFDEVRDRVARDFGVEQVAIQKEAFIEKLRSRYNVIYDDSVELADKQQAGERL